VGLLPDPPGPAVAGLGVEAEGVVDVAGRMRAADALERCGVSVNGRVVPAYYSVDADVLREGFCLLCRVVWNRERVMNRVAGLRAVRLVQQVCGRVAHRV